MFLLKKKKERTSVKTWRDNRCRDCNYVNEDLTRWRSSFYGVSDKQPKERFLEKGSTLASGEPLTIGNAYEST